MGFTVDEFNQAKSKMLSDFNKAMADAEALGRSKADGSIRDSVVSPLAVGDAPGIVEARVTGATPAVAIALAGE